MAFGSNDTLVRAVSGAWWPGVGFAAAVIAHRPGLVFDEAALAAALNAVIAFLYGVQSTPIPDVDQELGAALNAGIAFLDGVQSTPIQGVDQEREQLRESYRIVLRRLGCNQPDEGLVAELAHERIAGRVIEPFEDTHDGLARLRARGFALGVVANAGPSLEGQYSRLGLRDFFEAFVISAQLGYRKPDPRIYLEACARLAMAPEEVLLVDDLDNVTAAQALGLDGLVMARDWHGEVRPAGTVINMRELEVVLRDRAQLRGR